MKILVTGGAGLVGSHAAEYYARKGDEVVVLDNLMRSSLFGCNKDSVEFNWKPGVTIEKGLEKLIEWVGANNKFFI